MTVPYYDPEESTSQRTRRQRADLERLIKSYFPLEEHKRAIYVAWQVSRMTTQAYHRNGGVGIGLFDIDYRRVGLTAENEWRLRMPIVNVAAAHKLWSQHGWGGWDVAVAEADRAIFPTDEKG